MSDFIIEIVLFSSLGTIIFLIGRAVPRLGEEEVKSKKLSQFFKSLPIHKFDAAFASFLEKSLRKIRVFFLRVDNGVSGFLQKIKTRGGIHTVHPKKQFFFSAKNEATPAEEKNLEDEEVVSRETEV
ncbi:MAG TPA: hypothetical protein VJK04_04355 [Candidatus Paceibacterota bacterium]